MSKITIVSLDPPNIPPREISARLRSQLVYFGGSPEASEAATLGEGEYWFSASEVDRWVDEGVFCLVSPLDTANMTEVELTEEQEDLLNWIQKHKVKRLKVNE